MNEVLKKYIQEAFHAGPDLFPNAEHLSKISEIIFYTYPNDVLDGKRWWGYEFSVLRVLGHLNLPVARVKGFAQEHLWKLFWQKPCGRTLSYIMINRPTLLSVQENVFELVSFYWASLRGTFETAEMEECIFSNQ